MRKKVIFRLAVLLLMAVVLSNAGLTLTAQARRASCEPVREALRLATGVCQEMYMGRACNGHDTVAITPTSSFRVGQYIPSDELTRLNTYADGPGVALLLLGGQRRPLYVVFFGETEVTEFATSWSNPTIKAEIGRGLLCDDTRSGIVVQNRFGNSNNMTINGVLIELSSTAAITMEPEAGGGSIVFYSDRDGDWEIYSLDLTTDQVTQLTFNSSNDVHAARSPDGGSIAFQSDLSGNTEIFLMNANGSNVRQLTFDGAFAGHPAWSPNGAFIAYDSTAPAARDILVISPDGSNRRNLTNSPSGVENIWPVWSPNGQWIAFYSDRDGDREIYVMDANGGNLRQLTFNGDDDRYPAWSPDGSEIVFASNRVGNWELYTMDAFGGSLRRLTNNAQTDWGASYTADGQIVFTSDRDGDNELFTMNRDGSGQTQLTFNSSRDELPVQAGSGSVVDHWMVVTNMEGSVAAGVGTATVPIQPGQQIRYGMTPDNRVIPGQVEAPSPAGITFRSAVFNSVTYDTTGGLLGMYDGTIY